MKGGGKKKNFYIKKMVFACPLKISNKKRAKKQWGEGKKKRKKSQEKLKREILPREIFNAKGSLKIEGLLGYLLNPNMGGEKSYQNALVF